MTQIADSQTETAHAGATATRRLFISYSSDDAAVAGDILNQLETAGVPCWIAPRDIPPGADYASEIIPAIRDACALLFLYSQSANLSKHCLREVEAAISSGIDIFPVRLDATPMAPGLEYRLSTTQWIDANTIESLREVAAVISAKVAAHTTADQEAPHNVRIAQQARRMPRPDGEELVGRATEVAALVAVLDDVKNGGTGRMVLVGGESGVGKSTLVNNLIATAVAADFRVCATTCGSFLDGVSFFPVRELLRQLTDSSGDIPSFVRTLYGSTSQQANMAAVINSALVDAGARREAMLATFANVVFGASTLDHAHPLLLFIDDLENVDAGSVDSLLCLLARIDDGPVLVVGAFRDDVVERAGRSHPMNALLSAVRRNERVARLLRLGPLPRSSYVDVIESILGGPTRLPARLVEFLWKETEGNSLFLREIVRALSTETRTSTQPCLTRVDGVWTFRGSLEDVAIPRSVEEAIERNLEAVADADRGYLETASVIGKQFDFDLALGIMQTDEDDLLDALERCVEQSILHELSEPTDSFEFSHNRVRDVLYNSLSNIRRRRIHSKVADALLTAPQGEFSNSLIGEHLYKAERFAEAAQYLYRSAVALLDIKESERAADQLTRVNGILDRDIEVTGIDRIEVALTLLTALQETSDYAECEALVARITAMPGIDERRRGRAYDTLGDLERARGHIAEAQSAYAQAETLASEHPDLELEVCADLHELHDRQRERTAGVDDAASALHADAARHYLDREVDLAQRVGGPWDRARAYRNLAKSLRREGKIDEALTTYEKSLAETDVRVASHQVLISYAKTLRMAGRSDDASAVVQRVLDWSTQTGARRSQAIALFYRAMIEMEENGAGPAALRDLEDALAIHQDIGYDRGQWEVHLLRGEWHAMNHDRAAAFSEFRAGLQADDLDETAVISTLIAQLNASDEHARAERLTKMWAEG